jgi:hypothetical protein
MRASIKRHIGLSFLIAATACGGSDGGTPPADVNTISKNAGDGQTVAVGEAAAVAPSVRVTNQNQAPVANVAVTFAVASGGGQITGGATTTNASGIATVGSWTMGTVPGSNALTASAAGVTGSPITFTATTVAGPPKTITKQGGDNQTAAPSDVVAVRPSVKVVDQYGNPVAGVTVTFAVASGGGTVTGGTATTGADGVATVGNWTLGANQGSNTLTATVTGTGVTGNPATFSATAQFAAFNPTASVAITGDKTYSAVNIPAGVTVTINSDAVITVNGDYTQAGVVTAPCHTLRIDATGLLTASGNISNDCTDPAADGNDLVLIGRSGYNISNNEIASSGDIWIMDGPTLALPSISARPAARPRPAPNVAEAGPYRCRLVNMKLLARPLNKAKGANGSPKGTDGKSGTSRTSGCGQLLSGQTGGNLLVDGITMTGGNGAEGGDGTSSSSTPSVGGAGGEPGALNIVSDRDIDIQGAVTLNLGNGGKGGNATSTGAAGAPGVSVTATGGKGGGLKPRNFTSPVTIQSKTGTLTVTGTLVIKFGTAGAGGDATANGGAGNPGNPGAKGGDATANGGAGGDSHPFQLVAGGNVVVLGTVDVTGGAGGAGGLSTKNPGKGGDGNVPGASGGDAGSAFGTGGVGGKGNPPSFVGGVLAASVLTSPGGAGGSSSYSGGKGGNGAPNCPNAGGSGGKGGNASGGGGDRGNGTPAGVIAQVMFNSYGNGGNGAAGNGPAGLGGANGTSFGSGASGTPPAPGSFQPGLPGAACPSFTIALVTSYVHVGPGVSFACVRITGMADPFVRGSENVTLENIAGAAWSVQWSGPGTTGSTQRTGTLDAQSTALDRQQINQFGTYTANVSVTSNGVTKQASGTVSVGGTQGTCPP